MSDNLSNEQPDAAALTTASGLSLPALFGEGVTSCPVQDRDGVFVAPHVPFTLYARPLIRTEGACPGECISDCIEFSVLVPSFQPSVDLSFISNPLKLFLPQAIEAEGGLHLDQKYCDASRHIDFKRGHVFAFTFIFKGASLLTRDYASRPPTLPSMCERARCFRRHAPIWKRIEESSVLHVSDPVVPLISPVTFTSVPIPAGHNRSVTSPA